MNSNFSVKEFHHVFGEIILFTHRILWVIVFLTIFQYILKKCNNYFISRPRCSKMVAFIDFFFKMNRYFIIICLMIIALGICIIFLFIKYGFSLELVNSFDVAVKSLRKSGLYLNIWLWSTTPGTLFVFYQFLCCIVTLFFYKYLVIDKPLLAAYKENRIRVGLVVSAVNLFIIRSSRKEFFSILMEEFSSMKKGQSIFFLFDRYEMIANILFNNFIILGISLIIL